MPDPTEPIATRGPVAELLDAIIANAMKLAEDFYRIAMVQLPQVVLQAPDWPTFHALRFELGRRGPHGDPGYTGKRVDGWRPIARRKGGPLDGIEIDLGFISVIIAEPVKP